jgi:hypothetical protein
MRRDNKLFIDTLISDNVQPVAPKRGVGLHITNGRRRMALVNSNGDVTLNGEYYYKQIGQEAPCVKL